MTRVLCLTTGGTIAAVDAAGEGLASTLTGADVTAGLDDVEVIELTLGSSTTFGLTEVFGWALEIRSRLVAPDIDGAVLTIGTETMVEVAYLLDLAVGGTKPLVITGAMHPPGHPHADGPGNLGTAVALARSAEARGACVLVAMSGAVHTARTVTKRHASAYDAFWSPPTAPGAYPRRETLPATRIEERVEIVRAVLGASSAAIDAVVAGGARGLVLETFPAGGVTPAMASGVERALAAGVVVVAASEAEGGPTTDYAGIGEGRWLEERGVRIVRDLTPARARIRLALELGCDGASLRTSPRAR